MLFAGAGVLLVVILLVTIRAGRAIGEAQARLEAEEQARARDRRMADEMLRERTVEDVVRDLDAGEF